MSKLAGTTISMHVKHGAQGASGGSYWVDFQADITMTAQTMIEVEIVDVHPQSDSTPSAVTAAQQAIYQGCVDVLSPMHYGAYVAVTALVIHPVDFKPGKYAYWMAADLRQRLDELAHHS